MAAGLAAQGCLPLLAADKKKAKKKPGKNPKGKPGSWRPPAKNPYVKPCAIEPVTGVLPTFSPVAGTAMTGAQTMPSRITAATAENLTFPVILI